MKSAASGSNINPNAPNNLGGLGKNSNNLTGKDDASLFNYKSTLLDNKAMRTF